MAHWIVTYDHDENKAVDVQSRNCNPEKCIYEFKMYDDDDNLMYSGKSSDCNSEAAFAPLDDYGGPNVGCTYIKYKDPKTGKWEVL